jgi:hypothetical protein
MSTPIQRARTATPIHTVTVDKPIANKPTPRVQKVPKDTRPSRFKVRERIRKHLKAKTMTRIPQQTRTCVEPQEIPNKPNSYTTRN